MSIESMKEDGIYIEDPQKTKEIKDALNSDESAFADVKPLILTSADGRKYFVSREKLTITDPYNDICIVYGDNAVCYRPGSPTYDELYEHWLKTKDKPKKKRKLEQLPGQIDLFDIIDMEEK